MRLIGANPQMVKLHLRLCPGKRACPLECHRVVVLVGKIRQLAARSRRHGPEANACGASARNCKAAAQAEDRIEYGAKGVGQRPSLRHRGGMANGLTAAEKPRPVGLELHVAGSVAFDHCQMRGPDLRVAGGTPPPRRENRAKLGYELG